MIKNRLKKDPWGVAFNAVDKGMGSLEGREKDRGKKGRQKREGEREGERGTRKKRGGEREERKKEREESSHQATYALNP